MTYLESREPLDGTKFFAISPLWRSFHGFRIILRAREGLGYTLCSMSVEFLIFLNCDEAAIKLQSSDDSRTRAGEGLEDYFSLDTGGGDDVTKKLRRLLRWVVFLLNGVITKDVERP